MGESMRVGSVWIGGAIALGIVAFYTPDPVIIGIVGIAVLAVCLFSTIKLSS